MITILKSIVTFLKHQQATELVNSKSYDTIMSQWNLYIC